jgi:hypothetical protein
LIASAKTAVVNGFIVGQLDDPAPRGGALVASNVST